MGSELGITGDTEHAAKLDGVGIFWIVLTCTWTLLLIGGMTFLGINRHMPILRIRGLGLSFCAISLLHMYWISVQLGYVDGPVTPGDAEYWIMGTWLPCGIAMFHASNSRFLHIARKQRRFAKQDSVVVSTRPEPQHRNLVARFRRLDYTTRMLVLVGSGMLIQLFLTVLMYLISRKWHGSWGIPGTEVHGTDMEKKVEMGRGWEWWPSVFWQVFWAWIVAPYILWKARGIHDTQGWRVQTIACCVASLHATPMWLIALYVPQMERVNKYFIPPQWIAISIMVTEAFTIFLPCWEVLRHQTLKQETLDSIAQWENKNKVAVKSSRSVRTASTMVESTMSGWKSIDESVRTGSDESVLTMGALEHVLERNPEPLQQFSALRDFSGENIAFLTGVADWKSSAPRPSRKSEKIPTEEEVQEVLIERFNRALRIYVSFISARHADFPINISSQDLKNLESVFEGPARIVYGDKREVDVATPFDAPVDASDSSSQEADKSSSTTEVVAQFVGTIPEGFCDGVFDDAEKSIKYLVLTNTWPKFVKDVKDRRTSMDSIGTLESGTSVLQMVKERCK